MVTVERKLGLIGDELALEAQSDTIETEPRIHIGDGIDLQSAETDRDTHRERSTEKSRRRSRDRERDLRVRRDDSRDRNRRRRDGSVDSRHKHNQGNSKDVSGPKISNGHFTDNPRASSTALTDEQKKAERQRKLLEWKQKVAAEKAKNEIDPTNSTQQILDEMDKRAAVLSGIASPASPSVSTPPSTSTSYAGKFDPKAIAKKANASSGGGSALGSDILPHINKASATSSSTKSGLKANGSTTAVPSISNSSTSALPKSRGNVSGFGLSQKSGPEGEKGSGKRALDFGEDESTRKKLEKLPSLPVADAITTLSTVNTPEGEDNDSDVDMENAGTEEENAAAARAAAEKREQRLQNQSSEMQLDPTPATHAQEIEETATGNSAETTEVQPDAMDVEEEEDIDPLDAFMADLSQTKPRQIKKATSNNLKQPETLFGDDEVNLEAVEADPDDILAIASKARKKKDLPTVNHDKIPYNPFRKAFYNEPQEFNEMTEEEVYQIRMELDNIKVRGVDAPKPVQKWAQCGLGVQSLNVIQRLGYDKPTSIQAQALPSIMSGRDVIGVAKTGSGKTIAFLLPMFRHIKDQAPLETLDGPVGLIMTPTRELATQIHKECKPFLKALSLRAVCAYGGAPIKDQIADLKRGAEIIVCTPGRMIDLLAANSGRVTNLRRVTYTVLDEADRMFDLGFEPQVMKILGNIRPDKQTVLFSATFPPKMEALARKTLRKPVEIVVGGRSVVAPEITQVVEVRAEETKFKRLLELLGELYDKDEEARTLIFVDRQESADALLRDLMQKGYPCMSIHGGKDQYDRDSTIDDFKAGVVPIMIATSVAARGLDVKQLKLVVNYDAPNHLEDYVHRAGRTGRAGNKGTAVTFLTEVQERYALDISKALTQSGQDIPEDVQKLVDLFQAKITDGKANVFRGSGFGGKGLERLDQERDAARKREQKTFKTGDEGEDDDKEEKKEEKIIVKSSTDQAQPAASLPGVPKGIDLDGKITVHKTETPATATNSKNPLSKVEQAVANINSRLGQTNTMRSGVPIDNKGPDAGAFHATLEINDFPQKARWAVTNRTNVAKILEATGTSITTKGSFYPAGKEPPAGSDPKLYILVEGDTEVVVTNAMRELMRLLKEGTAAAVEGENRAPASGRYNVL
ncbi:MAG: pre-mRNA processing RNA-helicase [Vezdaea aestivalis]|nr:MAG: pre-mRNA processing RNA-helicase [Vezdaea aestivalis]